MGIAIPDKAIRGIRIATQNTDAEIMTIMHCEFDIYDRPRCILQMNKGPEIIIFAGSMGNPYMFAYDHSIVAVWKMRKL